MQDNSEIRLDKTKISFSDSFDNTEEKEYWHSRTPQERLAQVERLRQICCGEEAFKRMDKSFFEVVQIDWK